MPFVFNPITGELDATGSGGSGGTTPVSGGGTGDTSLTAHGVLIGEGTSPVNVTSPGTVGQALISGGASADPAFATTPVAGGGTGAVSLTGVLIGSGTSAVSGNAITNHNLLVAGASNAITSVAPSATAGVAVVSAGAAADPAFGTVVVAGGGTGAVTLTGVLTGNGASAVTANAVTNHGIVIGGASNAVTSLGAATNGQLAIGSTGANPVLATLTQGSGVTITNGAGTITIAASGGGTGDVVGPSSAIDNNICRFDGTTGKLIQSSGVQISDAGDLVANADLIGQNLQAQGYLTIESIGNYSGIVTLSSGTASVTGSFFSGNPVCLASCRVINGTPGFLVATLSGGNFTITSYDSSGNVQSSDNSDVGYIIVRTQ